jgi:type I restriction enzyme M protein
MITGELKSKIDRVWDAFWTGGISNPLTVIEQITYLLFIKRLDEVHTLKERKANRFSTEIEKPIFSNDSDSQILRWSKFKDLDPEKMYEVISAKVFPFIKTLNGNGDNAYSKYMKDATFMIPTPRLLDQVVTMLNDIPMEDRDTKGDLYEYLLSKLTTAGKNGQFRTPRHIIKMMVELVQPKPEDVICDPACGTAGFLVGAEEYVRQNYPEIFQVEKKRDHFLNNMFYGNDFDRTMLRIAVMNLILHGVENPNILDKDALSEDGIEQAEKYTLILANPPFKGSLDADAVSPELLKVVNTKKTELLFLALFIRLLKIGGRCAVIVPDGVLFGSSNAHVAVRKALIEEQKLEAVISMPSGVFKPYAGVSAAILIFTKTNAGGTDKVWFYDMKADGYSLDDKRTPLDQSKHENNNIPDIINRYKNLTSESDRSRSDQSFFVTDTDIRNNRYDLSVNRFKESSKNPIQYDRPINILQEIKEIEQQILADIQELENKL